MIRITGRGRSGTAASPTRSPMGLSISRVLASEWVKLASLRSTWMLLSATVLLTVGLPVLFAAVIGTVPQPDRATITSGGMSDLVFSGMSLAQLIIGALAVLFLSSEYSTGMIRSTITAVPTRWPVLAAKAFVLATVSYVVTTASVYLAFLLANPVLDSLGAGIALTGGITRSYLLGGVYVAGVALIGLALAELLRNSAGGIITLVGLIFVLPNVFTLIPIKAFTEVAKYLPGSAGQQMLAVHVETDQLNQMQGGAMFAAWVVAFLVAATVSVRRRDV